MSRAVDSLPARYEYPSYCDYRWSGHRAMQSASYAKEHPEELTIVGVADPTALRRERAAKAFGLTADQLFCSADELAAQPKRADFIINGTMDHQHVPTSPPLLKAGYDILLEKPVATSEDELKQFVEAARMAARR